MIEFFNESGQTWPIHNIGRYSDNTTMVKPGEEVFYDIVDNATGVEIKTTDVDGLFTGLAMVAGIGRAGGDILKLVLPYIPGARQDRVNPSGDVLFTLGLVADLINTMNFSRVVVVDPHSPMSGLIENMAAYPLENIYKRLWQGYSGVIAPDKGGVGRASIAAATLSKPLVRATKTRDVSTGRLTGFEVDVERGNHYLIVDDLCDGGGTFAGLMEKIAEQGAYADLYVTHGLFSKGLEPLKGFKRVITTDTVDTMRHNNFQRLDVVERLRGY